MAIKLHSGRTKFLWLPWTTAQTIEAHGLVAWSGGKLIPAIAGGSPTNAAMVGVIHHAITTASTEYSTQSDVEVEVPVERFVIWKIDVDAVAALTNTDQGDYMDLSSVSGTTSSAVDSSQSTEDPFFCVGFISATKGLFILNIGIGATTGTDL